MDDPLVWSVLLLLAGVLLVMVEVFVPSGGVLGFLSIGCLMAGIILAFYHRGPEVGFLLLAATSIAVPVALVFAFRWWPKTPMGRRLLLEVPTSDEVLPDTTLFYAEIDNSGNFREVFKKTRIYALLNDDEDVVVAVLGRIAPCS